MSGVAAIPSIPITGSDIGIYGSSDGTNWTSLTLNGSTYGFASGGSGSTAIDGKTIVMNSSNQLETAIGG